MKYSEEYYKKYKGLQEELPNIYPELNFDNHCYLRIALDNVFDAKWDTKLKRPAYKNLESKDLENVLNLLESYKNDKNVLLEHNKKSLSFRKK